MGRLPSWPWGNDSVREWPVLADPVHADAARPTPTERTAYEAQWGEFCREMDIARRGRNIAKCRSALPRLRQKAGLIRVDSSVAWITQQVEAGRQVACSVEFVATAADPIAKRLRETGIEVATIYGRDRFDLEDERLRFQTGLVERIAATSDAAGGDTTSLNELAQLLGADWVPTTALTEDDV